MSDTDTGTETRQGKEMPRPKSEPTSVQRLRLTDARKLNYIRRRLGIKFRDAFHRISGKDVDSIYRRLKAGEHVELGVSEAG